MTTNILKWRYDQAQLAIVDQMTGEVLADVRPGIALEYAMLLAQSPTVRTTATELLRELSGALSAFEDEEESVKEEHRELIESMASTVLRSESVLSNAAGALDAPALRAAAAAFLDMAHSLDGLQAYQVVHQHRFGETSYVQWAAHEPTEEMAATMLEEEFEPDRGESLSVTGPMTIAELTGAGWQAQVCTAVDDEVETDRPAA